MAPLINLITRRDREPTQTLTPAEENVLQQWRGIAPQDCRSANQQRIASLVDDEENREIALKFRGEDAATVIDTIDKVLKENQAPDVTRSHAFKLLRRLPGASRQVPKSYLVGTFHRYKVERPIIASGGFADVRKGKFKGMDVAVKTIRISQGTDLVAIHEAFCKECVVWMNTSHPNILPLVAVKIEPDVGGFSMISEMMKNGNIVRYISEKGTNRVRLLEDVARGLKYLHRSDIIHGDLKGTNILINNETPPRACISDFGLCAFVPSGSFDPSSVEAGGTFGYMAPELFSTNAEPSKQADMYAFGMVIYEVITGARPYGKRKLVELRLLTTQGLRPCKPEDPMPIGFGQGTWEFAERCWEENRTKRPSAREALDHFERVARTSTVVGPGLTIREPVGEVPPRPENSSRNLSRLFIPSTNRPAVLQQATYATRALVSNGDVAIPLPPANREPNLLGRMRRRLSLLRPAHRLVASSQGGT